MAYELSKLTRSLSVSFCLICKQRYERFDMKMKRLALLIAFLSLVPEAYSQVMYKALMQEHTQRRFGIGFQAFEPTGINIQMFRGFFCSNEDSYATRGVWELGLGAENVLLTRSNETYKDGVWKKGGFRVDLNYLYPVFTVEWGIVMQTYVGLGLQTGSRLYENALGDQSTFATGGNALVRLEVAGHGFEAGDGLLFVSVYVDAKFHKDFTEDFQYFKPSFGIRIRKAR